MMKPIFKISTILIVTTFLLSTAFTEAAESHGISTNVENVKYDRQEKRINQRKRDRYEVRTRQVLSRSVKSPFSPTVVVPRRRHVRNIVVVRPYGHAYWGYGYFYADDDAWKWLAFTAITLKILDNIDEASQRAHEAAQIKATEAGIGEAITWQTETSSGTVSAIKQGVNNKGQTCREFQQTVTIGNQTEKAHGTACLQADGSWKMV